MHQLSANKEKYSTVIRLFAIFIFGVPLLVTGCNIFEEGGQSFNLVVAAIPSTAGSVTTSGTEPVELLAIPNENWSFSHWSGDVESDDNPLVITLNQNRQVFANFVLSENETRIRLKVSDSQFITDLEFGKVAGATDGFDSSIDLEAPPSPPSDVLYAWFENNNYKMLHDFRNPFTNNSEWILSIDPGASSSIRLDWQIEGESTPGSFILLNSDESVEIDLFNQNSLELNLSELSQFRVVHDTSN